MAAAATALAPDKKRTTVTLPVEQLAAVEDLANRRNTTVSAIISQAMEAGLESLRRQERAQMAYEQLRSALAGLTEEEQLLVDGIRLSHE
jgi:hypothetical protein